MKYYCIGIKGTGMSTLAQILHDLGNEVSGYDDAKGHKFTQVGLEERNIPIYYDGSANLSKDTIVTYSVAFKEDHKELQRVKSLGLKIKKYNEIMADVIDLFKTIGVSGTHGKTSTSSMIRHILEDTVGCNYFIGAGDGYANKENTYYVVESDEFNKHFTVYHPTYSIITNIEREHLECYDGIDDIREAFTKFSNNTKELIIANGDNEEVRKIETPTKMLYYGFNENNDIIIHDVSLGEELSSFSLTYQGENLGTFSIPLFGKHMVSNAAAAIAMCHYIGISTENIRNSLLTFKNAKRRFAEEKVEDTVIIDDYAHHPTEIKATLEAVRQRYPDKRIVVVFKPNTYSRTKDFKNEFIDSFKLADKTYLTEIDCNRERQEDYPGITSHIITDELPSAEIIDEASIDKLKNEKNSVVCFLGCAYVDSLINAFKEELKKQK